MKLKKRSYIFISIVILLGAGFLFFTHTLNRIQIEGKTHRYLEALSKDIQGNIIFETSELKIFPLPHLAIKNILFIMPDKTRGTIKSLEAYPKLLPLITGKMKMSKLKFNVPDIQINYIPKTIPLNTFPPSIIKSHFDKGLILLKNKFPGIRLQITRGKLELHSNGKSFLYLTGINTIVKLPSDELAFDIDCQSSLWQKARITFWIHPKTYDGAGTIDISGFNIKELPDNMIPALSKYVSILSGNLFLSFTTKGFSEISVTTNGRISNMMIHPKDHEPLPIRCKAFNGNFSFSENQVQIKMDSVVMTEPEAILSGTYFSDKTKPEVTLEVMGQQVDAASVRKTALALVGGYRTAQKIFDYVRGGRIPQITFLGKAATLKDFKVPGAFRLDGTITKGQIYIPSAELDLTNADGYVGVYKGTLIGKNLNATLGNSSGKNGSFSIGLHGKSAPFYLETEVDADLSQLPPVLIRLIKNPSFQNEMGRIKNCKGHATGKLILGDRRDAIRPVVDVSDFSLSAEYLRTPLNITLTGKKFTYNERRIEVKQANGTWGDTQFAGSSAVFDWQEAPTKLVWDFETAQLVSEQIYPWLKSLPRFSASFNPIDGITGPVALKKTVIYGPMFQPEKWTYDTSGTLSGITLSDQNRFPGPINLTGNIKATRNETVLSETVFSTKNTQLSGSVALTGTLNHLTKGAVSLNGIVGPKMLPWFSRKIRLPFEFQKDVSATLSAFDVAWETGRQNEFSGDLQFSNKTAVSIKGKKTKDQVFIQTLTLSDQKSDALVMFSKEGTSLALDFAGHLDGGSLNEIIRHDLLFSGFVSGDFKAQLYPDRWRDSCFEGFLNADHLFFEKQKNFPFIFEKLEVNALSQIYDVNTKFTFKDEGPHRITGNIFHETGDIAFEVDLDSDDLTLDKIISYIKELKSKAPAPHQESKLIYHWPLEGDVYLVSKNLQYKNYKWSNIDANVRITPHAVNIEVLDGKLCDIQTPGYLVIGPDYIQIDFNPSAKKQRLEHTLPCISGRKGLIQGEFGLNGEITAGDSFESLISSIQGDYVFTADKGRIYKLNVLAKVFALLNITEIFRGRLPDLAQEGFAYESMTANGTIEGAKVMIKNAFIDGASMGIVVKGEIDTQKKELDLIVLVAPLKTVDFIIKQTPIVKNLIKGALVSIPIEIKGEMANPTVTTLAPADVDSGLLGIMKNTLKLPVTLIQPFLNPDNEEENNNESYNSEN